MMARSHIGYFVSVATGTSVILLTHVVCCIKVSLNRVHCVEKLCRVSLSFYDKSMHSEIYSISDSCSDDGDGDERDGSQRRRLRGSFSRIGGGGG